MSLTTQQAGLAERRLLLVAGRVVGLRDSNEAMPATPPQGVPGARAAR